MTPKKPMVYAWWMAGVGSFCYGFAISPMYYSWGFFLPEMRAEGLFSAEQPGLIFKGFSGLFGLFGLEFGPETQSALPFSMFSYTYHLLGPLVGIAMARWGVRSVVTFGACMGVAGFWLMSRADSFSDCVVAYGFLGGLSIGFAAVLPSQTLAQNWFIKYRARAIAIVLAGGGVVGFFINRYFGPFILEHWTWQRGWLVIAGISAVVAGVAAIFMRSTPEDVGMSPDGRTAVPSNPGADFAKAAATAGPAEARAESGTKKPAEPEEQEWTARAALRTYQFYVLVGLSIAYGLPWGVVTVYGRLHLEAMGFPTLVVGSILGWRVLISVAGRLGGSGGDFISPQRLLAIVLIIEGIGTGGLIIAETKLLAYGCVLLLGLGFGAAYVSVPVAYSSFYGRRAFGTTAGWRFLAVGLIAPSAPTLFGVLADWTGSYTTGFVALMVTCLIGSAVAFWLPHPGPAPAPAPVASRA